MLISRNQKQNVFGRQSRTHAASRRGLLLLDALIAGLTIGAACLIALASIGLIRHSRIGSERLQYASQELNNQLERAASLKWDQLTPDLLAKTQPSEMAVSRIPGSRLKLSVTEVTQPRRAKKLEAQIIWPDRDQMLYPPLRLTTWVFEVKETL